MRILLFAAIGVVLAACADTEAPGRTASEGALNVDLILTNGRVYSLNWGEPALNGDGADNAPFTDGAWSPDAEAIAIADGEIILVGTNGEALSLQREGVRVVDVEGATIVPGLVDSHTHIFELGAKLQQVDLTGIETEEEAVAMVAARAAETPKGEWILGGGWDEGAWANRYPDKTLLSEAAPDNPVALDSLHGFAMWVNQAALDAGEITTETPVTVGGEMRLGEDGAPNGLFLNRATTMIDAIVPAPSLDALKRQAVIGLEQMARDGYVAIHDAGDDSDLMAAFEALEAEDALPIRVYAMLSLRDEALIRKWIEKGPDTDNDSMLVTRAVKAYYDGALGSRGARLLADYADKPGNRGVSGGGYGFDQALNAEAMKAGFQIGIHAIGDAGNREAIDILEAVMTETPEARANRHRVEHAQIVHPADVPRFEELGLIASMEPPHAVEDKTWAEMRLGPTRIKNAYAWRTLREAGARLTFNSDLPGSDHSFFYGLHSAVTRRDKKLQPEGGWYPEQKLSVDETFRAYTTWAAYASFMEEETGVIAVGKWADLTVMDIDPFTLSQTNPDKLLDGAILMTIVNGDVVFEAER